MSAIIAYISNNAAPVDAKDAATKVNEDCPKLLQANEKIVLAFKSRGGHGRDDTYFTNLRIIIRDKTGLTGKKTKYTSIPYGCIKAYAVETAGSMDSDSELKIMYSEGKCFSMDFVARTTNLMAVKRFLNQMVLLDHTGATGAPILNPSEFSTMTPEVNDGGNFFDWLGDNATQIDASIVEAELKSEPNNILLQDEKVGLAFKCGRDTFLCTTKRLMHIDVHGISGKRVKYLSLLWSCIRAFSVKTVGNFFDRDSELVLYTNICGIGQNGSGGSFPALSRLEIDFKKGKADIYAVQRFFADKILGSDGCETSVMASYDRDYQGTGATDGLMSWLADDNQMIDAEKIDRQYHSSPAILQPSEHVEMAFKGRRDLVIFTTKRLLIVDFKGFKGKKVEYTTLPWKNVQVFGIRSAGSFIDKDSEMIIWTDFNDLWWPPKEGEDSPPPIPRKTCIEIDFQKDRVDLMVVHRYLSERCLLNSDGNFLSSNMLVSREIMASGHPKAMSNFMSMIGDDARSIDPAALNEQLHHGTPILQNDENIVLAYKAGRDMLIFSTKRVIRMDVQGLSGKKIEWQSIPYRCISAFSVESAGSWDLDAEVKLYCGTFWLDGPCSVIKQDLRKGKADIIAIQSVLAAQVFGGQDGSPCLTYNSQGESVVGGGAISSFTSWVTGDGVEINASEVNEKLHQAPPLLQPDESVEVCYKIGRDLLIVTTKRILVVDRQGLSGKKVEYISYPLRYCDAFKVTSAGTIGFLQEAKVTIYMSIPGASDITQELSKKGADIWSVQNALAGKIMNITTRSDA